MLPALIVAVAVVAFGPPGPLVGHRATLAQARSLAERGAFTEAGAVLDAAAEGALPEATELLHIHARMVRRLAALETTLPGLARRYVPYVFAPPTERLPAALSDLNNLVPHDPALQALLSSPAAVVVEHHERAVGLLLRGALVDVARRHGLPLRSAGEDGGSVLRVTVDAEDVPDRSGILGGMLRSYTTHVVVALERPGAAPVDSGVVMQLLGINESRALDGNIDRFVDRALTGFVVELIRRSLQGTLAG